MDTEHTADVLDGVVQDVRQLYEDLDVTGLPITGRVLRLARYFEVRREQQLERFGLTLADFDVLATMRRRARDGSMNVRDLRPSTMLSSGGTTKRLDRLENAGLIERAPDPNDRRGVLIRLTADGTVLIDQAIPAITVFENNLVDNAIETVELRTQVTDGLRLLLLDQERAEGEG
jgi:DNA-binding MarR family transcriptional regulator